METPKAFVSFDYENDGNEKSRFANESTNSSIQFTIEYFSSKPTYPQPQWDDITADQINSCNMLIVLVGNNTSTNKGVIKEIASADSQNIPIFGVYVSGAGPSTALPPRLQRSRTLNWDWSAISAMIEQVMKEGKNALLSV
jgi:hypothetical protein